MSEKAITAFVSVALAILGLAVIALLVSRSAQTGNVLGSIGSSLSRMICVALSPVTGGGCAESVSSTIKFE